MDAGTRKTVDIRRPTAEEMAKLLSAAGTEITVEMVQARTHHQRWECNGQT